MRSVLIGVALAGAVLGCSASDHDPSVGPTPEESTAVAPLRTFADLPIGRPPQLAYVVAGSSVVLTDRSVDLAWEVSAVGLGTTQVLVYDDAHDSIYRVGPRGAKQVSSNATSPPVFGGRTAWIEGDREIIQQEYRGRSRQSLPDDCCSSAAVIGYDYDINVDLFVSDGDRSWMWDTYEGREGKVDPPPDSEDYFWPVGGLGQGRLVATGNGSEVLVEYPGDEWGWGDVPGPRDPARDVPVRYREHERVSAAQIWLTSQAVVALERDELVVLGTDWHYGRYSQTWRTLTGERRSFALPQDLVVTGVVAESLEHRHAVLVDVTDRSGSRAWLRCNVRTYGCEVAAELGPDDVVPTR